MFTNVDRMFIYKRQNNGRALTSKQKRRMIHKRNAYVAAGKMPYFEHI